MANDTANPPHLSRELLESIVARWTERVRDEEEQPPQMPLAVLRGEAIDLAQLVEAHYQPVPMRSGTLPGLVSVAGRGEVTAQTAAELRELELVIGAVHSRQRHVLGDLDGAPMARADELLSEFRAVLSYLLEDGNHAVGEQQLARLREDFSGPLSQDSLAAALEAYAELAAQYGVELGGIGDFEAASLDEALNVARAIRQRSALRIAGQAAEEQRELMALRNRLVAALTRKMKDVRRSFRYVFRDYPSIAQKAGSDYLRLQRRQHRKAQADAEDSTDGDATLEAGTPGE